jgi:dihydrofolate reductase
MRRLVSYMFMSLDGFIADADGELDWVPIDDELMGFANEYFRSVDGIVFGRNTYRGFVEYWDHLDAANPSAPALEVEFARIFGGMARVVVATTLDEVDPKAVLIKDDVPREIDELKRQPGDDLLLISGPDLRSSLTRAGLVDLHRILVVPAVLGLGVPMFRDLDGLLRLRLVGTRKFDGGVVMLDYEPG